MSGIKSTSPTDSSRRGQINTDDRISDLPDGIIGNILSFLPTNNAVATGILSKRWKLLWTLAANLEFCCPEDYTGSVEHFVEFVERVLRLHKPGCFQGISLTWETGCIPNYVNTWISTALDRDVSELLFVSAAISELPYQLQSSLFSSESLKSLELDCNICIPSSDIVFNLPRLERLELFSVYFDSEEAIAKILNACPVLKYLSIYMDVREMVEHGYLIASNADSSVIRCVLSSASLTHLELCAPVLNSSPIRPEVVWCVELDVPSLHYIKFDGYLLSIKIQHKSLAFLDEAQIEINASLCGEQFVCDSLVQAFSAFGCVKTLILHDQAILAFRYAKVETRTKFERLTRLEVSIDCCYWSSFQDLMMLSDNLKVLMVYKYRNNVPRNNSNSMEKKLDLVPRCLSKSLQTVSISGYCCDRDELAMIEHILKHASVLKIMKIVFDYSVRKDIKRKRKLVEEIRDFPRKSIVCKVKFPDCC